uniref:Putative secreted protein n=1 Tax=Anopheles marajoara TaxID=58244 RepID=A0A2M4CEN1_9DIPT
MILCWRHFGIGFASLFPLQWCFWVNGRPSCLFLRCAGGRKAGGAMWRCWSCTSSNEMLVNGNYAVAAN